MDWIKKSQFLMALILAVSTTSFSVVYEVGDSAGWTVGNAVFYSKWSSARAFHLGDTIMFEYNPGAHSVLEVSRSKFHNCDISSPLTIYSSGNDTILLKNVGHYYYVCGFPGHCQAGQKVDIRVPKNNTQTVSLIPGPGEATIQFTPDDSPTNGGLIPPGRGGGSDSNDALSLISSSWFVPSKLGLASLLCVCKLFFLLVIGI